MKRADKPARPSTSGVLVVDKPAGITSFGVVAEVRRKARGAKTGHAGTLDPLASGVLVLALGRATRIAGSLLATEKAYLTTIDLSAFTATDDREAPPEPVAVAQPPDRRDVERALDAFRGTFEQRPPAFSAVKVEGRRSYQRARAGQDPAPAARRVTMHAIDIVRYAWPLVDLSLRCAKGLYVRSLARDLGAALGTGGHCASIRRTAVGPFTLDAAVPLDDVPDPLTEEDLIAVEEALALIASSSQPPPPPPARSRAD